MIAHHSHIGTAAWAELLRMLKDAPVSELRGSPQLKTIGNKKYWYDRYRIGIDVVNRYIGDRVRARIVITDTRHLHRPETNAVDLALWTMHEQSNRTTRWGHAHRVEAPFITPAV